MVQELEKDLVREIKNYKFLAPTGIMVITKKTEDKQETTQYFKNAKKHISIRKC